MFQYHVKTVFDVFAGLAFHAFLEMLWEWIQRLEMYQLLVRDFRTRVYPSAKIYAIHCHTLLYIDPLDSHNGFTGVSVSEHGRCPQNVVAVLKRTQPSPGARRCAYNEHLRRSGWCFLCDPRATWTWNTMENQSFRKMTSWWVFYIIYVIFQEGKPIIC